MTDRPQHTDPEQGPTRQARAGISRRRLFGSGGIVLLGVCAAALAEQADLPPARRERDSAVTVVHAHGLTLEEVGYPPDDELAAQAERSRVVRTLTP